jgi:multidrug efflux pump subunit AcrB
MSDQIDTKSGLIAWFARNNVAANLLMIFIILGGIFGIITVKSKFSPNL